jgi:hypothetical protein
LKNGILTGVYFFLKKGTEVVPAHLSVVVPLELQFEIEYFSLYYHLPFCF